MKKLLLLCWFLTWSVMGWGATHYISPAGTDAGTCVNSAAPCKTFAYALASGRMAAGDTLLLLNGTYTRTANGNGTRIISPDCSAGYANGTAALPITVKAQNARQAYLQQDGTGSVVWISGCSYWSFEDLRMSSADLGPNINPNERFFYVFQGNHISLKRNLMSLENRFRNEGLVTYELSDFALIEENELYENHRNGITMSSSSNATIRRNYLNSRNRADCVQVGCDNSSAIDSTKGDHGITFYPSSNNIAENNIVESYAAGVTIEASGFNNVSSIGNKLYGNIWNGTSYGYLSNYRYQLPDNAIGIPTNTTMENNITISPSIIGFYVRTSNNTMGKNNTSISGPTGNFSFDRESTCQTTDPTPCPLPISFTFTNNLAVGTTGNQYGFNVINQSSYNLSYPNSSGNVINFSPSVPNASTTNATVVNPNLGTCKAWIPAGTPMSGAGLGGADIGASVLYEYVNGALTTTPLWNPATNKFVGCGVVVTGVNDIAGSSCTNVDARLNINQNSCPFPTNYGGTGGSGIPPDLGWYQIPNTKIRPLCPAGIGGATGCPAVTGAWGSGAFDTLRNRLIMWGGGHGDYNGNEVYSLNLNSLTMTRLTNPGAPQANDAQYNSPSYTDAFGFSTGQNNCPTSLVNSTQPNSNHTYDTLNYLPNQDSVWYHQGSNAVCGFGSNEAWQFNLATNAWVHKSTATPSSPPGMVAAYDSSTDKIFIHGATTADSLYAYTPSTDTYQALKVGDGGIDYHMTSIVDPVHRKLLIMGGGEGWSFDISSGSTYAKTAIAQATGCNNTTHPGLAYDPVIDRVVCWNGGDTVYLYNTAANTWSSQTYVNGPGPPATQGTLKRLAYSPAFDVLVVVNSVDSNAYSLRLSPPTNDTTPPTVTMTAPANNATVANTVTVSANASDNVAVAGVQFKLDGGTSIGAEDTLAPYSVQWDTTTASQGTHTVTATARDTSGNVATATPVQVTVLQPNPDTTPPSVPTNLTATPVSSSQVNLAWTASTDAIGVTGYNIFRGGVQVGTSATVNFSDTGLLSSTLYSYKISAFDAAGNTSAQTGSVLATTLPPSTGGALTSIQLTAPTTGTLPFMIGMVFKKGDITQLPTLDITEYQAVIKRRWNDNSVKHVIISGQTAFTANVTKTINISNSSTNPSGTALTSTSIQSAAPTASVQLGAIGTITLSSLLASPFRTWLSGQEMVECHYRASVGAMSVWFQVRLYKAGRVWVRAIVENGTVNTTAVTQTYVPTVTIGGTVVYNNSGAALPHYANTRWMAEGWIGGNPAVTPKHPTQYLVDSKMVPNYWKRNPSTNAFSTLHQTYIPMLNGDLTQNMGDPGFQPMIGLLPLWDALYITSADLRAYNSMLANSSSFNSYPIVWRDSNTQLPATPTNWPNYGIGGGTYGWSAGSLTWNMPHEPSEGYTAYLMTGDYWHYETMLFGLAMDYLALGTGKGVGLNRILNSETRGTAWNMRNMAQTDALCPTGDVVCADYQTLLTNNITHWQTVISTITAPGIGDVYEYGFGYDSGGLNGGIIAPWQQHFWDQSMGMGSDIEPLSNMTVFNQVRDYLYKFPVGILGDQTNFYFTFGGNYNVRITAGTDLTPSTWYTTWAQVWAGNLATTPPLVTATYDNTLQGTSGGFPGNAATGYWGNLMPAIAYAVDHGATGASASWTRLTGATNWSAVEASGFDDIPVFGIVPRTTSTTTPPAPPTGLHPINP